MNTVQQVADYTLDAAISDMSNRPVTSGPPKISTILAINVESSEVRCLKGDCDSGDYVPECRVDRS
jgi:hypothetical protein